MTADGAATRPCPGCSFPLHPSDAFCEECGFQVAPAPVAEVAGARPEAAGMGAVGRFQAQAGEEIGGVDADSVQFDAAARPAGPPRRPGVRVLDADVDTLPAVCPQCSGSIAPDGYCEQCGNPAPRPRDHWAEQPAGWVALSCDRGLRHAINQDGAAVGAGAEPGSFAAMVVCDGVSSAARSELASLAAARAARDVLVAPREATAPGPLVAPVLAPPAGPRSGEGAPQPVMVPVEVPTVDPLGTTVDAPAQVAAALDPVPVGAGQRQAPEGWSEGGAPTQDLPVQDGPAPYGVPYGALPAPGGEAPGGEAPGGEVPGGEVPGGADPGGEIAGGELPVGSSAVQSRASLLAAAMREAGVAAQERAVAASSQPPEHNPPACTFAAAVIDGPVLVAGWVGDSRVYWLPDEGLPVQLSEDDSLAAEAIRQGVPRADAERSPHAHSITRWLGLDAPDPQPRTAVRRIDVPAWVLVCSDGLWNYCSEASSMRDLVRHVAGGVGPDPARIADGLVAWANEQGGHDNIAVVLARVG